MLDCTVGCYVLNYFVGGGVFGYLRGFQGEGFLGLGTEVLYEDCGLVFYLRDLRCVWGDGM